MLSRAVDRILAGQRWLEPLGDWLQNLIGDMYRGLGRPGRTIKTFLNGTWLGHPLHPVITDIPIGAWTLGVIFDIVWLLQQRKGLATAADVVIAVGIVAALGAVVTGYTDWNDTYDRERRVGLAHGLLNTLAVVLYAVSFILRWTGSPRGLAIVVALVGYAAVLSAGYLGGELVFNIGTGVNHHAWQEVPVDFVQVLPASQLPEGQLHKVVVKGTPIVLYKKGPTICAIGETCGHAGGPLSEGRLEGSVVICPWHASRFDICTGAVKGGPATVSQVRYEVRVQGGQVELRRSAATLQPN